MKPSSLKFKRNAMSQNDCHDKEFPLRHVSDFLHIGKEWIASTHLKRPWLTFLSSRDVLWSDERKRAARQKSIREEMERTRLRKGGQRGHSRVSGLCAKADFSPGLLPRVRFTWSTMQWASLWPSSVIKTGVSLATQSALFCHPSQPSGTGRLATSYPLFPSVPFSRVLSVCRQRRPLHARSLFLLLLFLRFVGSGRSSSVTRAPTARFFGPEILPLPLWFTSDYLYASF